MFCRSQFVYRSSPIKLAISAATSCPGKRIFPDLETRNFPSKFQTGSRRCEALMKNFQISEAPGPVTCPSFMRMPGKFFDVAKALISSSVWNSWAPNSRLGNPKMIRSSPYRCPRVSNNAYSRSVAPQWEATLTA